MPAESEAAVAALRSGRPVVIPTDTVYGLAADATSETAVRALYALKGRSEIQPTAVIFASTAQLAAAVPELAGEPAVDALLPGPVTLVVANPRRRYAGVCGAGGYLGVRVPVLSPVVAEIIATAGPVVATSANDPGGVDPRTLAAVPSRLREGAAAVVDGGELPGVPSTVVDLTGDEPRVVREGAIPRQRVLEALSSVRARG
ncbi:MAG: L-threonylcarbamoyladenylate synthase [Gaiellales bacterium]